MDRIVRMEQSWAQTTFFRDVLLSNLQETNNMSGHYWVLNSGEQQQNSDNFYNDSLDIDPILVGWV